MIPVRHAGSGKRRRAACGAFFTGNEKKQRTVYSAEPGPRPNVDWGRTQIPFPAPPGKTGMPGKIRPRRTVVVRCFSPHNEVSNSTVWVWDPTAVVVAI